MARRWKRWKRPPRGWKVKPREVGLPVTEPLRRVGGKHFILVVVPKPIGVEDLQVFLLDSMGKGRVFMQFADIDPCPKSLIFQVKRPTVNGKVVAIEVAESYLRAVGKAKIVSWRTSYFKPRRICLSWVNQKHRDRK